MVFFAVCDSQPQSLICYLSYNCLSVYVLVLQAHLSIYINMTVAKLGTTAANMNVAKLGTAGFS